MEHMVIGMRGDVPFKDLVSHFISMGGEVVLMKPERVLGRDHIESALMHAERSMANGTNRSRTILTEILLYAAWERQIGRAVDAMRPSAENGEYVALLLDITDPRLEDIGMVRDDSLIDATEEKAEALGLQHGPISYEDQAIENVALVDLMKL
jgi:KEOPS complex subunit Cgi121